MQVRLSSQKRDIIDHGTVFLFNENADFTLNIVLESGYEIIVSIYFLEDNAERQRIETDLFGNHIKITCINFVTEGTGLTSPMELAVMEGKKIYLMFWAYIEGNKVNK